MQKQTGTIQVKRTFPEMLKGGVICDVVNAEQARIAEEAGACAVMALERVPADIRAHGGVARMSDPELIIQIKEAVTIPVVALGGAGRLDHLKRAYHDAHASGVAAGSMFVFHGPKRGVLINYPDRAEITELRLSS